MFLRESLIARKLGDFEGDTTDTICLEFTIPNKIWFIIFAYRPPINNNKDIFFSKLSGFLNRAMTTRKYDNLLVIDDLNMNTLNKK